MADPPPGERLDLRAARIGIAHRKTQLLTTIAEGLASGTPATSQDVEELERLGKVEAALRTLTIGLRQKLELTLLAFTALSLLTLSFARLPYAAVDIELHATGMHFTLNSGTAATLVPGEVDQILLLKRATVSGFESVSPQDLGRADSVILERGAASDKTTASGNADDLSVRLQSITLPEGSKFAVDAAVAYSGSLRGIQLATDGPTPATATVSRVIPTNAKVGAKEITVNALSPTIFNGRKMRFELYPSDQIGDLAIFRDVHVSGLTFRSGEHSTILGGTLSVKGRDGVIAVSPSDILTFSNDDSVLVRELSLSYGELRVVLSIPHATKLLLGSDAPRNMLPTWFQWLLFHWPTQLYATLMALVALWLSFRNWRASSE
jgi:hypothetical protein